MVINLSQHCNFFCEMFLSKGTIMSPEAMVEEEFELEEETNEEEVLEEEEEETVTTTKKTTKKRRRKTFKEDQTFVYPISDEIQGDNDKLEKHANQVKEKIPTIVYSDDTKVDGLRVWEVGRDLEYDDENKRTSGKILAHVIARNSYQACESYLESKAITAQMCFKKARGGTGRGKVLVDPSLLQYAKVLAFGLFPVDAKNPMEVTRITSFEPKKDAIPGYKEQWDTLFAPGSENGHYVYHEDTEVDGETVPAGTFKPPKETAK